MYTSGFNENGWIIDKKYNSLVLSLMADIALGSDEKSEYYYNVMNLFSETPYNLSLERDREMPCRFW